MNPKFESQTSPVAIPVQTVANLDDTAVCSTSAPPVTVILDAPMNENIRMSKKKVRHNSHLTPDYVGRTAASSPMKTISSASPSKCSSFKNFRLSSRGVQLGSLVRTKLYSSFPNLHNNLIHKDGSRATKWYHEDDENVKKVLKAVASDHVVSTTSEDNKIRRTVFIERKEDEKFGFIVQSYAFRRCGCNQMEQITFVDYVALDGPSFRAGLRAGDVILAINGKNIQNYTHKQLVRYIGECKTLRMVVLFENCVNRIELCARAIKLKKLLSDKEFELKTLRLQEDRLMKGLPLLSETEILTLLRTPCNSPTIERVSLVSSISQNTFSSVGGDEAVSYGDGIQYYECDNNLNSILVNDSKDDGCIEEEGVEFVVGSETNSSKYSCVSWSSSVADEVVAVNVNDVQIAVVEDEDCGEEDETPTTVGGDIIRVDSVTRL